MKKNVIKIFFLFFILLVLSLSILSTIGIKTEKFNNFLLQQVKQSSKNIDIKLDYIKFKLDIFELSLYLETFDSKISYDQIILPTQKIRVYIDFISLIKTKPQVKKIYLGLDEINIDELKNLNFEFMSYNLKNFIQNKIKKGNIASEFDLYFDNNNILKNFIAKGRISNAEVNVFQNIMLEKIKLNFFADDTDILLTNISGQLDNIKISEGDLSVKIENEISIKSSFFSSIQLNKKLLKKLTINESLKFLKIAKNFKAEIQNNLSINFDKNYKIKNYNYLSDGKIIELDLNFLNPINDLLSGKDVKDIYFKNNQLKTKLNSETKEIDIQGEYSFDDIEYLKFNLKNKSGKENYNLVIDFDYSNEIYFELINYRKTKEKKANLSANIEKKGNELKIKKISYVENDNKISIDNLILNNNFLKSFDNISVKTIKNNKLNNEFEINTKKKIYVKGTQFDATNLPKVLSNQKDKKFLYNLNKEIEIDLSNIIAPLSENLKNFKLLGYVDKGKFSKISSKGDFGNNNFLDISMQNDSKKGVKYLEVYSDLPKPLLTEYSFFKGLSDGKLIYSSIIDKNEAKSKLTIENFKLINAPGAIKLLSLADLGGLADLVSGEGLSFNILEIKMTNTSGHLKLEEIFATGPSISVLMEGYQDKNGLTSLRGTLVPAKTLNKMISKIPVIGDIVIPKEVGEGLFGISFKMKGPKGKVKTTINPIRTLTPRFIQKIVDRKKSSK